MWNFPAKETNFFIFLLSKDWQYIIQSVIILSFNQLKKQGLSTHPIIVGIGNRACNIFPLVFSWHHILFFSMKISFYPEYDEIKGHLRKKHLRRWTFGLDQSRSITFARRSNLFSYPAEHNFMLSQSLSKHFLPKPAL